MSLGDQAEDRVVAVMKRFGYTGTDARTYIAVLRHHPATGYELAARGGVPRSAIYGVLKRLEQAGLVNAVRGKPARYIPLAPERLIEHLESRFSRDIKDFRDAVTQVSGPDTTTLTWTVSGYEAQLAEAERLIDNAEIRSSVHYGEERFNSSCHFASDRARREDDNILLPRLQGRELYLATVSKKNNLPCIGRAAWWWSPTALNCSWVRPMVGNLTVPW